MSLAHAMLGFLTWESLTGYELKHKCFDTSVAHFWQADQAQIYRTLDKLTEQGFVESYVEHQEDRPNRKVYTITDEGKSELDRWLRIDQPLTPYGEPFLIQLCFGAGLPDNEVIRLMEQQLKLHRERLAVYEAIPLPELDEPGVSRQVVFQRFTLEMGLHGERAYIEWLERIIQKMHSISDEK